MKSLGSMGTVSKSGVPMSAGQAGISPRRAERGGCRVPVTATAGDWLELLREAAADGVVPGGRVPDAAGLAQATKPTRVRPIVVVLPSNRRRFRDFVRVG